MKKASQKIVFGNQDYQEVKATLPEHAIEFADAIDSKLDTADGFDDWTIEYNYDTKLCCGSMNIDGKLIEFTEVTD